MQGTLYGMRPLPPALRGLEELAFDLRWSWHHAADALWEKIDADLWRATANPWLIMMTVSERRFEELARDEAFVREVRDRLAERREQLASPSWFSRAHASRRLERVAYFSMEFGLGEALPIYSGGLGILAGDHLKTASDLGVPLVGVGLLYQEGYFRQALDASGEQLALYPYNDPVMLPVMPLRDANDEWVRVSLELPGRHLQLRAWQARAGRVMLYLLDSNDPLNNPRDRGVTNALYGGDEQTRLLQEMALGIGGWRLLGGLGFDCDVCHLNEGHAAFAVLERARELMERTGQPFAVALAAVRGGNLFTTHTPVAAGFDRFAPELIEQYLRPFIARLGITTRELLALGRADASDENEPFNMAHLAVNGCGSVNGVSRLHGEVSRRIFQPMFPRWPRAEVPVGHVTNGVHVASWHSQEADALWADACGEARWLGALETVEEDLRRVADEKLWGLRERQRRVLVESVRRRLAEQRMAHLAGEPDARDTALAALDPSALTVCFARRFATYKRPDLLLHDPARLARILSDPDRPVQLVVAGKAHPHDGEGRRLVRAWADYARQPELRGHVVFLEDYDMALAAELVAGADLWLNTPRRPWEASGTSGMKVLVNGGLNLSELDGWWAEAFAPEVGWALGDGEEHDGDPVWDAREAAALYATLEQEVVPAFYERDARGVPSRWVARMRESMARLTPRFSTNRMVREYTEEYYLPGAERYRERAADNGALAAQLEGWSREIDARWPAVRFGDLRVQPAGPDRMFLVELSLGGLDPTSVRVELYAEGPGGAPPERHALGLRERLAADPGRFLYGAVVPATRPAGDYTPRVMPNHPHLRVPLEARHILWLR